MPKPVLDNLSLALSILAGLLVRICAVGMRARDAAEGAVRRLPLGKSAAYGFGEVGGVLEARNGQEAEEIMRAGRQRKAAAAPAASGIRRGRARPRSRTNADGGRAPASPAHGRGPSFPLPSQPSSVT